MAAGIDPALSRPVDALLIPEGGSRLRALAPLLPFFDIDPRAVKFIGTGLWDDASLGSEPALLGGWYAGPAQDGFEAFRKRFEQAFNRSEGHTSELQSLMRNSYAVFCLEKKNRVKKRAKQYTI